MLIEQAILTLREEYLQDGRVESTSQINNGLCVEFAEQIEYLIPGSEQTSNDFYIVDLDEGWNGNENDKWNKALLDEANAFLPAPYTLEMANQIRGYHRWIEFENKHYDAECPEGVSNFFDLPFFKVWLSNIYEQHKKTQRQ